MKYSNFSVHSCPPNSEYHKDENKYIKYTVFKEFFFRKKDTTGDMANNKDRLHRETEYHEVYTYK